MHKETVARIMSDPDVPGKEKRRQVFAYLSGQEERGVPAALECLLVADSHACASYLTQYLSLIPGAHAEKTRAAEWLRTEPELVDTAARLVVSLPGGLLDGFVADYLSCQDAKHKDRLSGVLFSIADCFPERIRPIADEITESWIGWYPLSGSSDDVADTYVEAWRAEGDPESLESLALIRTDYAVERLRALRAEAAEAEETAKAEGATEDGVYDCGCDYCESWDDCQDCEDCEERRVQWDRLLALAGRLPDTGEPAGYRPAYRAFVAERGASEHLVGVHRPGDVPLCHSCKRPGVRVLRLSAASLPYGLTADPEFYWYSCGCSREESVTVRITPDGPQVYDGPSGPADPGLSITPGELSLVLEEHPNQRGFSRKGTHRGVGHQVGGLPTWVEPLSHPRCPECGHSMPYLATVSERTAFGDFRYADSGALFEDILYGFWCDGCQVSCTEAN